MPVYEPLADSPTPQGGQSARSAAFGAVSEEPKTEEKASVDDVNEHFSAEARVERMQSAMLDIMDGAVTRGRSLKYWENLRLKPVHMQMLLMKAAGFKNKVIAEQLGYDESRVSVIVNHPDAMYLLSHLVSYQAENLLDVKARIQAHAGEALDTALVIMRTGAPEVRERVAFKILDRAGYGAVQKSESVHRLELPAAQAANLSKAVRESMEVDDITDAEWEEVEASGCSSEGLAGGTGEPEVLEGAHTPEGRSRGEPPSTGLQAPSSLDADVVEEDGSFRRPKQRRLSA